MAKYITVETYTSNNKDGVYEYYLMTNELGQWKVMCFRQTPEDDKVSNEEYELDFQWEVFGKVVGYKDGNPNRTIIEGFTETTAREEFDRWRR